MTTTTPAPAPPDPLGGERYRLTLPNTASSARIARAFVASLLAKEQHGELVDDAKLCVTELVTNAYRHTSSSLVRVHVAVNRKRVTVSVADFDPLAVQALAAGRPGLDQPGGRGLLIVESLALAWGTTSLDDRLPGHKAVWFTLGRSERARVPEPAGRA
ncbi:ATP-binding protein [Streptomyces sp. NPDC002690]